MQRLELPEFDRPLIAKARHRAAKQAKRDFRREASELGCGKHDWAGLRSVFRKDRHGTIGVGFKCGISPLEAARQKRQTGGIEALAARGLARGRADALG